MPRSAVQSPQPVADLRPNGLYDTDVYSWALEQARLIREGRWDEIDLDNVAEEIESVGKSEHNALESSLARVIQHMLKWDYQEGKRTRSWVGSIDVDRVRATLRLEKNPGLKSELDDIMRSAYRLAVAYARKDTGLSRSVFPESCAYDFEAVMMRTFRWPDAPPDR